ncbi:MAG TPA: proton-conducting transporter membrane subunit [Myxococcota bacterium]|nr:proton-conducting transporter membrane subunit [Myxococcota bacterium]
MSEPLAVAALSLALASALPGALPRRFERAAERISALLMIAGAACGLLAGFLALAPGAASSPLELPWSIPAGRIAIEVDALSAVFLIQISLIAALGSVYGLEYWSQRAHPGSGSRLRAAYGVVTAGMLLVVIARNGVLFLIGWELMALAAFVALTAEHEKPAVRSAGYIYLLATRTGTLGLYAMFALLLAASGTLDFDGWAGALRSGTANGVFLLALLGFGLKAGIVPLHVWLPSAHAAAPSHVSALMSGVLIKMGIYGLVRITSLCDAPPVWWGEALLGLGVISAVLGVALALGQHDLKRLLAYHSVENIGIICLGLGVALIGRSSGRPSLIVLGMAGALLHTWNHGLFKALLFLSAGSVLHATGTREIDRLGGLRRRMPATALAFLVGAVAICGLPPLNGLISELLVYLGLFRTAVGATASSWPYGALAATALALVGGLAIACFTKVFGAVFLGSPRSPDGASAHESGRAMLVPMGVLALLCAAIGLGAPLLAPVLDAAVGIWAAETPLTSLAELAPLRTVALVNGGLVALCALLALWLGARVRGAQPTLPTWDCGFAPPAPRAQYTASSFADLLLRSLTWILYPVREAPEPGGLFPRAGRFQSHLPDTVLDRAVLPTAALASRALARLRPIQQGSVHLYLLYILATVVALLVWR